MINNGDDKFIDFINKPSKDREQAPKNPEYNEKIVAFVDILGMSEYMRQIKKGKKSDATMKYNIINLISDLFSSTFKDTHFSKMEISDSFVISTNKEQLSDLINKLASFQLQLLIETGFLLRGAITYENIIDKIDKNRIIGPAFVLAHDLEVKVVIYPRIIIDKTVVYKKKTLKLKEDSDKYIFIDYLSDLSDNDYASIKEIMSKWNRKEKNRMIVQKRNWFKKYYEDKTRELR